MGSSTALVQGGGQTRLPVGAAEQVEGPMVEVLQL